MRNCLLLSLCCLLLQLTAFAQNTPFEQQYVQLANGSEQLLWIRMDEEAELLQFKTNEADTPEILGPAAVVSFLYGARLYYSLPVRDGYYTFFSVYHEGSEFAVLGKAPSYKALRLVADESGGQIGLCQNRRNEKFTLCFTENSRTTPYGMPTTSVRKFEVNWLFYLAIEGQLKLFYLEIDDGFNLWNDWAFLDSNKRSILKTLDASRKSTMHTLADMIQDPEKMSAIEKKVKAHKLDIRDPRQLIQALEAAYH